MKANKTVPSDDSVVQFISKIEDHQQRADSEELISLMQEVSGEKAVMWGLSIVGFGITSYTYASGRQGDWMRIGFSPRKGKISLYVSCDVTQLRVHLEKLGKHDTGKGCIYIKKLEDINKTVLRDMIREAYGSATPSS